MKNISEFIRNNRIFTIVNIGDYELAKECAAIAVEGGLKIIEISNQTPDAGNLAEELLKDDTLLVGMSVIADDKDLKLAMEKSVHFVSLGRFNRELIKKAKDAGLFVISEAMTPTEIIDSAEAGADIVGVFPVESAGGAKYIKLLLETYPFLKLRARGGLNIYNFVDMLDAGAMSVALSTGIFDRKTIKKSDFNTLRKKVNLFTGRYQMWESLHT